MSAIKFDASTIATIKYVVTFIPNGDTIEDECAALNAHLDKWEVLLPMVLEREGYNLIGMGCQGVVLDNKDGTCTKFCILGEEVTPDDNEITNAILAGDLGVSPKVHSRSVEDMGDGRFFASYVMDIVKGQTLYDYIAEGKDVSWVNTQLDERVELIHSYGLVHKDLHRKNILVTEDKQLVFIDWGLSSSSGEAEVWWLHNDFNLSRVEA
jgi:hypothetical protein